ncbi:hypothetical protein [Pseudomonas fluorescens]|uniref:Uncharacterized protein n=1 Tax=Pseudomonas fluorescens TaxID=294 RepID=A0A0F4TWJ3_PSEFL|nr:hypothetical protein [Pseudomonas fluorescens]KJZ48395.1 hypothetical protein VC34_01470 [Pseudomonas fluorescens]
MSKKTWAIQSVDFHAETKRSESLAGSAITGRGSYRGGSGNSGAEQPVTRKSIVTALQQQSAFDGHTIAAQ